jgi:hypothetical protein
MLMSMFWALSWLGGMAARDTLGSGQTQLNTKADTAMTTFILISLHPKSQRNWLSIGGNIVQ